MRQFIFKALLIIAFSILLGCDQNNRPLNRLDYTENVSETYDKADQFVSKGQNESVLNDLKIIKTGEVRYQVKNILESTIRIKKTAQQVGGYISNLQFKNNRYSLERKFTIKIPQRQFDRVLDSINNSVEFIDYENINTRDVTEEYVDAEARLKTKLEVKSRYESVLRSNAKTVKDILETEEKLGSIQEEIEAAQRKLRYLKNRVSYSTITIELYEKAAHKEVPVSYEKSFWVKSKEGFSNGWNLISLLILGIISIWPLILALGLLFFLLKRRQQKQKPMNEN